mmetsp:Transcript_2361/g.7929  ORF Transcript_2361/g.7929 Transcript_2361/m.7929 type:complete len:200 (-) Transcript_2361:643-1242(-)
MQCAANSAVILAWDHSLIWKNCGPRTSPSSVHTSPAAYTSFTLVSIEGETRSPPSSARSNFPSGSHVVLGETPMQEITRSAPTLSPSDRMAVTGQFSPSPSWLSPSSTTLTRLRLYTTSSLVPLVASKEGKDWVHFGPRACAKPGAADGALISASFSSEGPLPWPSPPRRVTTTLPLFCLSNCSSRWRETSTSRRESPT